MLQHINRLKILQAVSLPAGLDRLVHQNRLLKNAREGAQMTPNDLAKFEPQRRHATLVAIVVEACATVTDEIVDLHDRILGRLFNIAKKKHQLQFHLSGKSINDKVRQFSKIGRALLKAKESGSDAFEAIETVMPWHAFTKSVTEAEQIAQPESFVHWRSDGRSADPAKPAIGRPHPAGRPAQLAPRAATRANRGTHTHYVRPWSPDARSRRCPLAGKARNRPRNVAAGQDAAAACAAPPVHRGATTR